MKADIEGSTQTTGMGTFEVTKARIHDDLLQEGLKKKPSKSAASFVTFGEPDIILSSYKEHDMKAIAAKEGVIIEDYEPYGKPKFKAGEKAIIEIRGLDIYDPIKDEVKARNVSDIAYWLVDDDYCVYCTRRRPIRHAVHVFLAHSQDNSLHHHNIAPIQCIKTLLPSH